MQRSSRKIFTAHYTFRNTGSNLTPVTGTTNGLIFSNNQFINGIFLGVSLTYLGCKRWILYVLLFYLQYRPVQTDAPATGAANIGGLNFSCLFERAEIQIPVNKYECPQRLSFSPGNLFWGSFTNHNTGNYLRHGINITTSQRPGKQEHDYRRRFTDVSSPGFSWGRGDVCTQAIECKMYMKIQQKRRWLGCISKQSMLSAVKKTSRVEFFEGRFLDENLPFLHKKKAEHSTELSLSIFSLLTVYF